MIGANYRLEQNLESKADLMTPKKQSWLYCGKVNGRYLIYQIDTKFFVYQLVSKDFFRGQTGDIKSTLEIIKQNEIQFEASRRMARKRKKRYMEKQCLK